MTNTQLAYRAAIEYQHDASTDGRSRIARWPFKLMSVGEFISVDDRSEHDNASCAARWAGKKHGMRFQCKTVKGILHIKRIA